MSLRVFQQPDHVFLRTFPLRRFFFQQVEFPGVGKRGEKTEKEVKQTIKKMLVGLIARSEKEGGYWGSCDEAYDREFKGLLERAERGRKVQTYLNERGNRSFEAGVTILGAIRNK